MTIIVITPTVLIAAQEAETRAVAAATKENILRQEDVLIYVMGSIDFFTKYM
jgi:hypothetical protein